MLADVEAMDSVVIDTFRDDIIDRLIEKTPAKEDFLVDPSKLSEKDEEKTDGSSEEGYYETLSNIDSILDKVGDSSEKATSLENYISSCLTANDYLKEYMELVKLSQGFPAVDEELGSLAEAKDVSDNMKKVFEGLNEIDYDNLEYDKDNSTQSSLVSAWKSLKDGCYSFIEGFGNRSEDMMKAGVEAIRTALNSLKEVSDSISTGKDEYTTAYNSIPELAG